MGLQASVEIAINISFGLELSHCVVTYYIKEILMNISNIKASLLLICIWCGGALLRAKCLATTPIQLRIGGILKLRSLKDKAWVRFPCPYQFLSLVVTVPPSSEDF